jgi:hypothetical protein
MATDLSRSDDLRTEVDRREDEEEVANVGSECESVNDECESEMGIVRTLKLRQVIGMVSKDW